MIKKQLSALAGSVLVASGANAAIDLSSGDALAVFNTTGAGSFYQFVGGSNGNSLLAGNGFAGVDVSAAAAFLGGIESFALIALADGTSCNGTVLTNGCYNYTEFLYVENGGGLVFAGSPGAPTTNGAAQSQIFNIQAFLDNANLGGNGEGSLGDFDSNANVAFLLNFGGASGLAVNGQTDDSNQTNPQAITLVAPSGAADGVYLDGNTFNATAQGGGPVVPVPAAAWLFGSALMGLGVIRRKK